MTRPIVIANCSGFFGDRLSAAKEQVQGGHIDVLTGDWLAELTMLILARTKMKNPEAGWARTFLTQLEDVLGECLDRGIKIVSNAGGLNPAGCAKAVRDLAGRLGLQCKVAHVEGDDLLGKLDLSTLTNLDTGESLAGIHPITANAYLGGFGIATALSKGADVVVTGRVTDAALVVGPAAWHHEWKPTQLNELAGAVVAGHIIECGAQATGGNYAFFHEVPGIEHVAFPIAEVHEDGSSVITKHEGTGGLVDIGTVTAQLLYEIGSPAYANPDVVARFDTIQLEQEAPNRVRVSGVEGLPPPPTVKVGINHLGGFRNSFTFVLTGLDIEAKAAIAERTLWDSIDGGRDAFGETDVQLIRTEHEDPASNEQALAYLKITVMDPDPAKVGRKAFGNVPIEMALATYPGFFGTSLPDEGTPYGVFIPTLVPSEAVRHVVVIDNESVEVEGASSTFAVTHSVVQTSAMTVRADPSQSWEILLLAENIEPFLVDLSDLEREVVVSSFGLTGEPPASLEEIGKRLGITRERARQIEAKVLAKLRRRNPLDSELIRAPLGVVVGARSGDKGGNANLGVWTRKDASFRWLDSFLTIRKLKELLPETRDLEVQRFTLPNLNAMNFVIHGLLGKGVAASTRMDPQAKGLGEYLRAKHVEIPRALL